MHLTSISLTSESDTYPSNSPEINDLLRVGSGVEAGVGVGVGVGLGSGAGCGVDVVHL